MTRVLQRDPLSPRSSGSLLHLLRAAAAGVIEWGKQIRARVQSPEFESGIARRAPGEHPFGFVCSYSDAEFQIMLAELHYPRRRTGGGRVPPSSRRANFPR